MDYFDFVEIYEEVSKTTKRLEKVAIISEFLKKLVKQGKKEWVYLLNGRVVPDYDSHELGLSDQLVIKGISYAYGIKLEKVIDGVRRIGDLGEIAEEFNNNKKQTALFNSKLSVSKVFDNLSKIMFVEGKGAVEKKMNLLAELLNSSSPKEAKYIVRTVLSDLRIGIAEGILRDAISLAFFEGKDMNDKIGEAYDIVGDLALVLDAASKGLKELDKIGVEPGRPIKVMLPVKVLSINEGFEVCGKPAALEHKYDGFRVVISKSKKGIKLYTRKLEEVTNQFPDVVNYVNKYVSGETFILDSEVVGYDPKNKKYMPFQSIGQRIRRKYDIDVLMKKLPVEINVFDILFYNGNSLIEKPFIERREIIDQIISTHAYKIRPAVQFITDDEKKAEEFYRLALSGGEEGIMMKKINAPYKQGRRVGYMVKIKPEVNDLDLVIVKAEYGSGKRGGWLTSFTVACKDGNKYLEIGKVSSGLKEIEEQGFSYNEMTKLLNPLIIEKGDKEVRVKPKIVISVTYQDIQTSPSYDSGFALRFPRITSYRPDRKVDDITSINDIKMEVLRSKK